MTDQRDPREHGVPIACIEPPWGWGRKLSPAERTLLFQQERVSERPLVHDFCSIGYPDDGGPRANNLPPWQPTLDRIDAAKVTLLKQFEESLAKVKREKK